MSIAARLVSDYIALHNAPTREGIAALFTADFAVFGTSIPEEGLRGDGYLRFLESLQGTSFVQEPGSDLLVDEQGRLVLRWVLTRADARLASGVDYFTLQDGKINRVVGVY